MKLSGLQLIGSQDDHAGEQTFRATDPQNDIPLEPAFFEGTGTDVDRAVRLAEGDFDRLRAMGPQQRGGFIEDIANQIMALGDVLVRRACAETALPVGRIEAERGRTCNQLLLFARMVREGSWVDARIDRAQPGRSPAPKPDLRMMQVPLGPVAVFGAGNFPLAFSVAGGDTASALAAGCPVVVKGHPGHPGTSELVGRAIRRAASRCGVPAGVFSLVQGRGYEVGEALVRHPLVKAVAFTGSLKGGRALFDLAASRPEPIPVFAEMGSTNPVFILPGALRERGAQIARDLVESVTLGVGQFCTNPGLVFAMQGPGLDGFVQEAAACMAPKGPGPMLGPALKDNYQQRLAALLRIPGVEPVVPVHLQSHPGCRVSPLLLKTEAHRLLAEPLLGEELFGPASIIVACADRDELLGAARALVGQLTATVHGTDGELADYRELLFLLERKAGRILLNGFPTGVEVCDSMAHGGPYPATTDGRSTSVGSAAIRRFLRPVCYQNFAQPLLPEELRDRNSRGIWRLLDGVRTREDA
ncbi:fatty aldehyde dehydrogenase [Desulfuromonas versatilis]|uniref:Fatty aldehyde dehydrogenase n=1 Tax=Desulfuromonas versatilis TaxID=2802975 RepID=A0ABM8HVK1_9BACT|nr:aldehyde dehydrogenase (NADP(+)) [Desulfuromonas versatilis]BCR04572.1 fatty aldehyde dehydrogenase [Desulfuromonas versatilis]